MDQNQPELTFEESLKQVMQTLPPVIRTYLSQGKYTIVAKNLMAKYGLRIDQGGVLEREIMLLLMGVETPDEFTQALIEEAQLAKDTINGIVQDVNDQIFVPLRKEEEQSGGMSAEQPARPVMSEVRPSPILKVEPQGASHFNLENKIPPHIAPLPPKTAMPRSWGSQTSSTSLGEVVRSILPAAKPVGINRMLEDHEEPSPSLKATEGAAHIDFPPLPKAPSAPVNLPGAMSAYVTPAELQPAPMIPKIEPLAQPVMPKPEPVAPPRPTVSAPAKSSSHDPYREPIDEPLSEM